MISNSKLQLEDGKLLQDLEWYRRLVGKLNYLTLTTLDIAFPMSIVHLWTLKKALGCEILYKIHDHCRIEAFSNLDWARCLMDRRSSFVCCVFVGGNLVSWKSKKQTVMSRSNADAEFEYGAMVYATSKLMWIFYLLCQLGIESSRPMHLLCDN